MPMLSTKNRTAHIGTLATNPTFHQHGFGKENLSWTLYATQYN